MAEKKAFVTGYPVHHSRSPQIHRYWLQHYGIEGSYETVETTVENFPAFIHGLKQQGWQGGNITLPHKEQAFVCVEKHDEVAAQIGAVNTVWFENDILCGANTDAYGFARNLDDFAPDWVQENALVIGAGGAARAVLFALRARGFKHIVLINRTRARAETLAAHFGAGIIVDDWQNINHRLKGADLIVNTTALGMESQNNQLAETMKVFDFSVAKKGSIVTDIVYTPLLTSFLQQAKTHGVKTVDGLGMLLHQAVPGFERWFGIKPQVTPALRAHILGCMGGKAL